MINSNLINAIESVAGALIRFREMVLKWVQINCILKEVSESFDIDN